MTHGRRPSGGGDVRYASWLLLACLATAVPLAGCTKARRSSLLLERYARGTLEESGSVGKAVDWQFEPVLQNKEQHGVTVTVNYASMEFLRNFFNNKKIFGEFAGQTPYFPENLAFYVKISNQGEQKIRISASEFVLVDDLGNQYSPLNVDYVTAFAEYRAPVATVTRGLLSEASPGYFGISVPVGRIVAQKPQDKFALIQQSSLQSGFLHPGVVHDGLIAFWNPSREAKQVRLLLTNIKTDFNSKDEADTALEFAFTFTTSVKP